MAEHNPSIMSQHSSSAESSDNQVPSYPFELNLKRSSPSSKDSTMQQEQEENTSASKTLLCNKEKKGMQELVEMDGARGTSTVEDSGREKLKRHRVEMSGRVWIPDMWGQEDLLKDWIDCSAFDAPLVPSKITMAREALVEEGRRANASGLRIENRC